MVLRIYRTVDVASTMEGVSGGLQLERLVGAVDVQSDRVEEEVGGLATGCRDR